MELFIAWHFHGMNITRHYINPSLYVVLGLMIAGTVCWEVVNGIEHGTIIREHFNISQKEDHWWNSWRCLGLEDLNKFCSENSWLGWLTSNNYNYPLMSKVQLQPMVCLALEANWLQFPPGPLNPHPVVSEAITFTSPLGFYFFWSIFRSRLLIISGGV